MKKDVHIYLDYKLANRIDAIAKMEKRKLSDIYARILNQGFAQEELLLSLKLYDINFKKIISNTNYTKALIRKMYSDLNIKYSNETNKNLIDFDNFYLKKETNLSD